MSTAFDQYERRIWATRAAAYSRSFAALCGHTAGDLLDAASAAEGVRVLDVGTGPGTVAALAATRGATVTAVDAEPSMVDLARRNAPAVDVRQAILPDLPFAAGSFDAVVANFVVNHVGDPRAAVTELRRVARSGGAVAVTVWPGDSRELQTLWQDVMAAAGISRPADLPVVDDELNFERSEDGLVALLGDAGLSDVSSRTLTWEHVVDRDAWWTGPANGMGALGHALDGQSADVVANARNHYEMLSERFRADDGLLHLPVAAILARGTRAD